MGRRTKARECALQMLYQWDLTRAPMDEVAASFWRVRTSTDATKAMAERLARGAQANAPRLDGLIAEAATNWRFDRIAAVDRNRSGIGLLSMRERVALVDGWLEIKTAKKSGTTVAATVPLEPAPDAVTAVRRRPWVGWVFATPGCGPAFRKLSRPFRRLLPRALAPAARAARNGQKSNSGPGS